MLLHLNFDKDYGELANQLQNVGNGFLEKVSHNQILFLFKTIKKNIDLVSRVSPDVHIQHLDNKWPCDRAALFP